MPALLLTRAAGLRARICLVLASIARTSRAEIPRWSRARAAPRAAPTECGSKQAEPRSGGCWAEAGAPSAAADRPSARAAPGARAAGPAGGRVAEKNAETLAIGRTTGRTP